MELKGSQTEKCLQAAFAGESQARNKYTYFASKAKKEGYEQIAALFLETADNEKEHAKLWFKYLEGGEIHSTVENLEAAEKTTNGRICIRNSPKSPKKKDSRKSLPNSAWLQQSKKPTKNATKSFFKTSKKAWSSSLRKSRFGNAATADISSSANSPRRFARFATTRSLISNFPSRIIDSVR